MDASSVGNWLVVAGLGLVAIGAVVWLLGKAGVPLGRLPGDLSWKSGGASVHVPIVTCLVISVVLTVVVNVLGRFGR